MEATQQSEFFVVAGPGIEPGTSWLWIMRSNQLSYPAIVSWLRVQRYDFYLNLQNISLFFLLFLCFVVQNDWAGDDYWEKLVLYEWVYVVYNQIAMLFVW